MLQLQDVAGLHDKYAEAARASVREFALDQRFFAFNTEPAIMGVVNLSRDSWYRESVALTADAAIQLGTILHAQGAAIIDVGAESTLASAARVDDLMQESQLLPVVRGLRKEGILVSVETYHPSVARACLEAGANLLNLTGQQGSKEIYRAAAEHQAAVIICYVQGRNPREVSNFDFSADPIRLMHDYFARALDEATACGVNKLFIDPGLGFYYRNLQDSAVRVRHQMDVFLNSFRLRTLGFPVCHALPHAFEFFRDEVRTAEPFFALLAALGKTDLFRTHEVPKVRAVLECLRAY